MIKTTFNTKYQLHAPPIEHNKQIIHKNKQTKIFSQQKQWAQKPATTKRPHIQQHNTIRQHAPINTQAFKYAKQYQTTSPEHKT